MRQDDGLAHGPLGEDSPLDVTVHRAGGGRHGVEDHVLTGVTDGPEVNDEHPNPENDPAHDERYANVGAEVLISGFRPHRRSRYRH